MRIPCARHAFLVVAKYKVDIVPDMHCSLLDLVPPEYIGTPQFYVSHAWSGRFTDLVAALVEELMESPWRGDNQRPQDVMVWIGGSGRGEHTNCMWYCGETQALFIRTFHMTMSCRLRRPQYRPAPVASGGGGVCHASNDSL